MASAATTAVTRAEDPPIRCRGRFGFDVHLYAAGHPDAIDRGFREIHHAVVLGAFVQAVFDEMPEVERADPDLAILAGPR